MILDKKIKSQGGLVKRNMIFNWYSYELNHYGATHPTILTLFFQAMGIITVSIYIVAYYKNVV